MLSCFILIFSTNISAQDKSIVISDSLKMNSDELTVKMGSKWFGKIWKFSFGQYAVISGKLNWMRTNYKTDLLDTRTNNKSSEKFSFRLAETGKDTANVNALNAMETKAVQEVELLPHFFIGKNELVYGKSIFSVFITLQTDTVENWILLMSEFENAGTENGFKAQGIFTNGSRKIFIVPAKSAGTVKPPALGYELFENAQPIAALQYFGGGMFGLNKNIIWLSHYLDGQTKLRVAAALTALLQLKSNAELF